MRASAFLLLLLLLLAACAGEPEGESVALDLPSGLRAEVVAAGLQGPTQLIAAPDGEGWWVGQLAGPERQDVGQVVAVAPGGGIEVLLDGLATPTGIAVWRDALWVQTPRELLRAPLADGRPGDVEAVLTDLPNNGRSQGTLSIIDDALVFTTTGSLRGGEPVEGSGRLWALREPDAEPEVLATGFKNAYAHATTADGAVLVTEIAEPIGGGVPVEELNVLVPGGDYGWPGCAGDGEAISGGSCAGTEPPLATFPPSSTPTSVVVSPFDADRALVALWVGRRVVSVPLAGGEPEPWLTGVERPQHLLADGDGALLLVDHGEGRILRIRE
jgi:glucose/arabinose dehydrogenase